MKKYAMAVAATLVLSGIAGAAKNGDEKNRMESGASFSEQQTSAKLNSKPEPVRISGEFSPIETAKCNAEAKNINLADTKTPPALKSETGDKKDGKTAEKVAAGIGVGAGIALGVVEFTLGAVALEAIAIGAVVAVVAGAIGYGAVAAYKKLTD